jgi:hypothetical protein
LGEVRKLSRLTVEEESSMHLFGEAQRAMEAISQEADFFAKARKKSRPIVQGDYAFAGTR